MERAHHGYLDMRQTERAVRCAFRLGLMLMNAGSGAKSSGWMARGERILGDAQGSECAERGMVLLRPALSALAAGKAAEAQQLFERMARVGEQFRDADLVALGRLGHGQAMIRQGAVANGIELLDETMVTVETENVFPVVHGIVYCAVIETCRKVWELKRAQEWTSALTRWCEAHPDVVPFRGQCLVRRAEIIQFHGEWSQALEETTGACALLTRRQGEPAAGEAYYRRAELQRLLGDLVAAEDSYRDAARWGRHPQPGLALLRLSQGQDKAAETSIRNTLHETTDAKKRAELLPATVNIMLAASKLEEAHQATEELSGIAKTFGAPYLQAVSAHCQGAVSLAEGNLREALEQVQGALKIWATLPLPYESARTRELKGLVYRTLNDHDNADAEFAAAAWIFEQLRATPDLQRVNRMLDKKKQHYETHGLTLRELQVLRRVASGKTNKVVGEELFISERTVDRHVSNIFRKLDVSSRVEASAFILRNKIPDDEL